MPRAADVSTRAVSAQAVGTRSPVALARLEALAEFVLRAEGVARAEFSITLVAARRMAQINREHLGHRGATDVITFALGDNGQGALLADVYICPEVARSQAGTFGVGIRSELQRLVVHSVLHACGWEHPDTEAREQSPMWRRQELLLKRWGARAVRATARRRTAGAGGR